MLALGRHRLLPDLALGLDAVEVAAEEPQPPRLALDDRDELDAVKQYNSSLEVCKRSGDNGSRELFEKMVKDEENHIDFLEAQLQAIKDMGIGNYLAEQLHKQE